MIDKDLRTVSVGLVGCGYWGPKLIRNFQSIPGSDLHVVADLRQDRLNHVRGLYPGVAVTTSFAELLQTHSRQYDVVARLGGEEFVVLLPETPLATAVEVAERMRAALAKTTIPPLPQPITASFGVAELVSNESPETLLYRTDQALYEAKISGRNRVVRVD